MQLFMFVFNFPTCFVKLKSKFYISMTDRPRKKMEKMEVSAYLNITRIAPEDPKNKTKMHITVNIVILYFKDGHYCPALP